MNTSNNSNEEEEAYDKVTNVISNAQTLPRSLSSIPSLCSTRNVVKEPPVDQEPISTLLNQNHGHHSLFRALEELEKLDKEIVLEQDLLNQITKVVTNSVQQEEYSCDPLQQLQQLGMSIPRRVCQHPFKKNDIVWVCRTCQADETCVLCHDCYSQSHHEGHDVAFYHAQAGGCCDCGDPDAWDPAGFCPHHGPNASIDRQGNGGLEDGVLQRVRGIVPAAVDWLVNTIAANAEKAHARVVKPTKAVESSSAVAARNDDDDDDESGNDADANQDTTADTSMAVDLEHVFCPEAASTSKSIHGDTSMTAAEKDSDTPSLAEQVGRDGLDGEGLFLILHADDIHTSSHIVQALRELYGGSAYFTDSLLTRLVSALRKHGQLIVWGSMEVVGVCSDSCVHCWLDGDKVASTKIASVILAKAAKLSQHELVCSIATRKELQLEQRAVAVLNWLAELARSCDPLCQTVAECILPDRHLVPMLRADFKVSAKITKAWHSLLLTLLAVPTFKSHLAAAYCDTYHYLTKEYASGMGVLERSAYTLSVQFLNRVTYVVDLVQGRDLLGKLGKALLQTFDVARIDNDRLNPNHFVLAHRRYSPCISDLKCVLNVKGMARLFASSAGTFLQDWIAALSLAQFMDSVSWRPVRMGHVEVESRGWVGAFNASISLGSLFERLLSWDDDDASPIDPSQSVLAQNLLNCVDLNFHLLTQGVGVWQSTEMAKYHPKAKLGLMFHEAHKLCPASLPFSTVASKNGTHLAFNALPVAQDTEWSFHLPLHRFVAASLREACRRPIGQSGGVEDLILRLMAQVPEAELDSLFRGLMEFPSLVLTRAAQIRAGLWRRNGSMMHDQVLNYAEPPFCRSLRDADILLLQFAALGRRVRGENVGCSLMVNLLLHRFGIFGFLGFAKAPNGNIVQYKQEVERQLYSGEEQSKISLGYVEEEDIALPWTYTPATDLAASLALLEEFLHLLIVLITELPSLPAKDNADHTSQAKQRLRREVVHRLASGTKTHSELAEVHHVLSHWDNFFLSEEGKHINPDDASGAALGQALAQVADRKSTPGKMTPHHWELKREAWDDYDPSFFHISTRSHQSAAENRPKPSPASTSFGVEANPFAPTKQIPVHPSFKRLERDITADATVLAVAYRTLHVHCTVHSGETRRDVSQLRGAMAYHNDGMSETALSRVVHLLTLGAFAWKDASADDNAWRNHGGGSSGSVFHAFSETPAPTARDWVALALLSPPSALMDSTWYEGEENTLLLLRRLAVDGGVSGGFISEDRALRSGAAWLCEFALKHNSDAAALIDSKDARAKESSGSGASELERRKQAAKQKALDRMKEQAAKFAQQMMESEEAENEDMEESEQETPGTPQSGPRSPRREPMSRSSTLGSESFLSTSTGTACSRSPQRSDLGIPQFFSMVSSGGDVLLDDSENDIPDRLLKERPQCIICVDDGGICAGEAEAMARGEEDGKRKRSRRKTGSNALAFVGYAQASTVQKGGGGPPPAIDDTSSLAAARRFAGTHVALCGHVMHSECCESYLASVSHREDRSVGRRDEFRCPLCQRLSNCLVPFIDVGVDWTGTANRADLDTSKSEKSNEATTAVKSSGDDGGDQSMEMTDVKEPTRQDLETFLSTTPWWVSRNDGTVVWDGQCAFISPEDAEAKGDDTDEPDNMEIDDDSPQSQRRRVRSLRKKDLYAAWTAMMRTPRFVRRKLRPRSSPPSDDGETEAVSNVSQTIWPTPPEETSGETVVWRRLMDLISDVAFKADGKRLGERYLHHYCGEFRHYIVEKSAYNIANREGGRSNVDWPACISTAGALEDARRQELSREKLLAKLLMSVQAFTYSSCCEAREAKRVLLEEGPSEAAGLEVEKSVDAIYSKYGIVGVSCDGKLVLMPSPSVSGSDSDGMQPFNGRLGKLRHLGLAVMAACGAVSADLVQLVMCFPLEKDANEKTPDDPLTAYFDSPARAPIVFPILLGHVLTHVVAAMCAACGRARARSDCLELTWPAPFSRRGSFSGPLRENESLAASVANDCEGFIKLGVLARILQILLNRMDISESIEFEAHNRVVMRALWNMIARGNTDNADPILFEWTHTCFLLLELVLSNGKGSGPGVEEHFLGDSSLPDEAAAALEKQFRNASSVAASETVAFLADVGVIYQMLVPGAVADFKVDRCTPPSSGGETKDLTASLETLQKLLKCLGLEPINDMLQSSLAREIVKNWYETARSHARISVAEDSGLYSGKIRSRLHQTEGFRCYDWPLDSIRPYVKTVTPTDSKTATAMLVDTNPASIATARKEIQRATNPAANAFVSFSSQKFIQLLGGYATTGKEDSTALAHPRVPTLATSYTDLYATLGSLCPDCDQTAICLICGEILNAGGKGECTKHSYRCGGGACIFFLLQECVGLILHGDFAAYVHSPYVDSHGETPQYRGRPLNLDLDRYNLLHEMWSGHGIRQKVVSERGSARQVIIADFY